MDDSKQFIHIVTWKVEGLKSISKDHLEEKECLDLLGADIICFQETKVAESALKGSMATAKGYNAYSDFPRKNGGTSGVVNYCKKFSPVKTEAVGQTEQNIIQGRAVITQHQICVPGSEKTSDLAIVNVYCPQVKSYKRGYFQKMIFYKILGEKVEALLESGSHVIVVGDINTVCRPIDHCDPRDMAKLEDDFYMHFKNHLIWDPEKGSIRDPTFMEVNSQLIYAFNNVNHDGNSIFTLWSKQLKSVHLNYGSQNHYVLVDEGLKVSIKDFTLLKDIKGSDYCPVRIVLNINALHSQRLPSCDTRILQTFSEINNYGISLQHSKQHESSNYVGERKHEISPAQTVTKRQKQIEACNCTPTVERECIDVNLPSTSNSVTSVHHVNEVPASKGEELGLHLLELTAATIWEKLFKERTVFILQNNNTATKT